MEMYTQALALVPEVGYREWEANHLATLGNCQSDLGNISAAIEFHSKALSIRQEIGNLDGEAEGLTRMAELLIDERRYTEAISKAGESMLVVARVNTPSDLMAVKCALASAYIYVGDHSLAAAAAADAAKCDVPNNHKAFTLLGVALLRSGDHTAAQEAFERAISRADFLLRLNQRRYMALYDKALALCGLVACGRQECLAPAKETYRAARSINCDSGMLLRAVRLLDVLRVVDADELLVEVRAVATGQSA
jgi:tetratricopeptide (TPR) repeat protein